MWADDVSSIDTADRLFVGQLPRDDTLEFMDHPIGPGTTIFLRKSVDLLEQNLGEGNRHRSLVVGAIVAFRHDDSKQQKKCNTQ